MRLQVEQHGVSDALVKLGDNIRTLRELAGLSQVALAARAGINRQTLNHLESGKQNPSIAVLLKISRGMGVSIHHLLADID